MDMSINEKIEWLEKELKEIKKEIIREEVKGNVWKPKEGEEYHFLTDDGWLDRDFWEKCDEESGRLCIGNIFKTKKEAEFASERLRVIAELKQFARPFDPGQLNYFIYFSYFDNKVKVMDAGTRQQNDLYFKSEKIVKEAIKEVGEDRVKEFYLQINE